MRTMLFVSTSEITEEEFLAIAGTAESSSEHPLGTAVLKHAKEVSSGFLFSVSLRYTKQNSISIQMHIYFTMLITLYMGNTEEQLYMHGGKVQLSHVLVAVFLLKNKIQSEVYYLHEVCQPAVIHTRSLLPTVL